MTHPLVEMNRSVSNRYTRNKRLVKGTSILFLFALYLAYYAGSLVHDPQFAKALTVITVVAVCVPLVRTAVVFARKKEMADGKWLMRNKEVLSWLATCIMLLIICISLVFVVESWKQMKALCLCLILIFILWLTSANRRKIKWKLVITIFFIEFMLASFVLRTPMGYDIFLFVLKRIGKFCMWYSAYGAASIYGMPTFLLHPVAMFVTSSAIYSTFIFALILHFLRNLSGIKWLLMLFARLPDAQLSAMLGCFYGFGSLYGLLFTTTFGMKVSDLVTTCVLFIPAFYFLHFINNPFHQPLTEAKNQKQTQANVFVKAYKACAGGCWVAFTASAIMLAISSLYYLLDDVVFWLSLRVGLHAGISTVFGYVFLPLTYLLGLQGDSMFRLSCWYAQRVFGLSSDALKELGYVTLQKSMTTNDVSTCAHLIAGFSTMAYFSMMFPIFQVVARKQVHRFLILLPRLICIAHLSGFFAAAIGVILTPTSSILPVRTSNFHFLAYWMLKAITPKHNDVVALLAF